MALVLADLTMPEMSGIDLLSQASTVVHGAKRLLTVTWGELDQAREPILRAVARDDLDGIVAKPWRDAHESFYREVRPISNSGITSTGRNSRQSRSLVSAGIRTPRRCATPCCAAACRSVRMSLTLRGPRAPGRGRQGRSPAPAILFNGRVLTAPSTGEVAAGLGVNTNPVGTRYDVTIIGSGPSGLAAAVYAASEGMSVLVIEQQALGGQASSSAMIRNYLGFPRGLSGAELTGVATARPGFSVPIS